MPRFRNRTRSRSQSLSSISSRESSHSRIFRQELEIQRERRSRSRNRAEDIELVEMEDIPVPASPSPSSSVSSDSSLVSSVSQHRRGASQENIVTPAVPIVASNVAVFPPNRLPMYRLQGILSSFGVEDFNVKLVCPGKTFDCNLIMLQMASDVFLKMFETEMSEKKSRMVDISDVDSEMMEVVIHFYENGILPELAQMKHDTLQYIIEKYQLVDLKKAIAQKVVKDMRAQEALQKRNEIIGYMMEEEREAISKELGAFLARTDVFENDQDILNQFEVGDVMQVVKGFGDAMKERCAKSDCAMCQRRWKIMFRKCRSWIKADADVRSKDFQTVFSLFDFTLFDLPFLQRELCEDSFVKGSDFFLSLTNKFINQLIQWDAIGTLPSWQHPKCKKCREFLTCQNCGHLLSLPFHASSSCLGSHGCSGNSSRCSSRICMSYVPLPTGGFPCRSQEPDSDDDDSYMLMTDEEAYRP